LAPGASQGYEQLHLYAYFKRPLTEARRVGEIRGDTEDPPVSKGLLRKGKNASGKTNSL